MAFLGSLPLGAVTLDELILKLLVMSQTLGGALDLGLNARLVLGLQFLIGVDELRIEQLV